MLLAAVDIAGRKPEIIMNEVIQIAFGRKQQRQRIQQAGLTPGVLADEDVILLQLE